MHKLTTKLGLTALVAGLLIVGAAAWVWANGPASGGQEPAAQPDNQPAADNLRLAHCPTCPGRGFGGHGMMGPRHRAGRGWGQRGWGHGYVQPTPEAKKLWDRLVKLELNARREQWKLFELLAADAPDEQKVQAQLEQLRTIRTEIAKVQQELAKFAKPGATGHPGHCFGRGGPGPRHGGHGARGMMGRGHRGPFGPRAWGGCHQRGNQAE